MEFVSRFLDYQQSRFVEEVLASVPRHSGVYAIFDVRGKLVILDKTSNLHRRLERYFGPRPERVRHLDLRDITGRIEFIPTYSSFETLYLLYRERRRIFPKTYRKMHSFRMFTLMKINLRQRFPRIYASRQIRPGVEYFGPFSTKGQFNCLKAILERTFKLRPCLYNIRGDDPHRDCMYFQMHTCSRPCNNDVDRPGYLENVRQAIAFIEGIDPDLESELMSRMNALAGQTRYEEAELLRRRLEKIRRARQDIKNTFFSVWKFDYIAVLPSDSVSRCKIAFIRQGSIIAFEEYDAESLTERLEADLRRIFQGPIPKQDLQRQYDEFCLVCNFLLKPLKSVDLIPVRDGENLLERAGQRLRRRPREKATMRPSAN